ncbi:MAG: hypothetical protein EZS28_018003 [Streblomastix strix]|uniref:Uncharacterized protein n=1 Tax=Streblomastix strix TaxID=222440 RepID=A0A5J4VVJ6_9EUKA|nr:MAG: hypothetical protein EZS28_018003 [Streblomastix strix]
MDLRFPAKSEGQKPDLIYLLNTDGSAYEPYNVRIVNMKGKEATERKPTNTINQIKDAKFTKIVINNDGFTFDDAPDPQILTFEIIGEVGGTMI